MRKVLIITEGQTELIFVRNLLINTIDSSKLSFECIQIRGNAEQGVPYPYKNPDAELDFLIIDVGNDEAVMDTIKERERHFFEKGFEKIIGIRDMYCAKYRKRSRIISDEVIQDFIDAQNKVVQELTNRENIAMCFAIMETEAWFISMHTLLQKVDPALTIEYIKSKLGFDLQVIDPQQVFFHPSDELKKILGLVGRTYTKSKHEVEMVTSGLDLDDLEMGTKNGKCSSFKKFLDEIELYSTVS